MNQMNMIDGKMCCYRYRHHPTYLLWIPNLKVDQRPGQTVAVQWKVHLNLSLPNSHRFSFYVLLCYTCAAGACLGNHHCFGHYKLLVELLVETSERKHCQQQALSSRCDSYVVSAKSNIDLTTWCSCCFSTSTNECWKYKHLLTSVFWCLTVGLKVDDLWGGAKNTISTNATLSFKITQVRVRAQVLRIHELKYIENKKLGPVYFWKNGGTSFRFRMYFSYQVLAPLGFSMEMSYLSIISSDTSIFPLYALKSVLFP
jgi:hypothetical protein